MFETSALTNHNVENAFQCLVYQVIKPCLDLNEVVKSELSKSGMKARLVQAVSNSDNPDEFVKQANLSGVNDNKELTNT